MRTVDEQMAGLRKTARLHEAGDTKGAIHSVVDVYKDDVREAPKLIADLAKILAHGKRNHPGPFHGMDERMFVGLLTILSQETDKTLASSLIGLAVKDAATYTWDAKCKPHQFMWRGRPVFMTTEDVERCPICHVADMVKQDIDAVKIEDYPGQAEVDGPEDRIEIGMSGATLELMRSLDAGDQAAVQRFIAAVVMKDEPTRRVDAASAILKYLDMNVRHCLEVVADVADAMQAMEEMGVVGRVNGITEPDAIQMIVKFMSMPKAALTATIVGLITELADVGKALRVPEQRTEFEGRPAELLEGLLGKVAR